MATLGDDARSFDLGGHSLNPLTLLSCVHVRLSTEYSLTDFFDDPTVRGMSTRLRSGDKVGGNLTTTDTPETVLYGLDILDVRLEAIGDVLCYDAPRNALSPKLVDALKRCKPERRDANPADQAPRHGRHRNGRRRAGRRHVGLRCRFVTDSAGR
ncbi:phosphopantetheine-binding protein [Umezawaea sp. Da 62-37]|uniref:phosphopantetheine-binding protein n=1 Tax=Umezawaea sp. Da 62-37 TaxID=3075927 RepID=UPI0028F71432|nr:phosphopantetheine-binding protein [Umezawaea sp. Da 62-37]WNV87746.1 phosphopantetheine-binding protein [Umezawaea sp. Da 62-37]